MVLSETGAKQGHVILFVCPFFRSPCKFGNKKKDLYRGKKNTVGCLYSQSNEECWKYEGDNHTVLELRHFPVIQNIISLIANPHNKYTITLCL